LDAPAAELLLCRLHYAGLVLVRVLNEKLELVVGFLVVEVRGSVGHGYK
jgi:hypothetical protein